MVTRKRVFFPLLLLVLLLVAGSAVSQQQQAMPVPLTPEQRSRLAAAASRGDTLAATRESASSSARETPVAKKQWATDVQDNSQNATPQQQRLEQQINSPRDPAPAQPAEGAPAENTAAPAPAPATAAPPPRTAEVVPAAGEAPASPAAPSSSSLSMIKIDPATLNFVDGCNSFYPSGFNIWEAVEMGYSAKNLWAASLPSGVTGPALLREILDTAAASKLNTIRILAHGVNKEGDMSPAGFGTFNENVAKGLDYVVAESGKRGIRLILSLTSNWGDVGSLEQFVRRAGGAGGLDPAQVFFTFDAPRKLYLQHSSALANRVNTITGVRYGDDPTIFAINLINEPRCRGCGTAIGDWVSAVAPLVKKEWKQLLTIGAEGFYSDSLDPSRASANPGGRGSWAGNEGQSFSRDHASPAIDFMSIHCWADNWKQPDLGFLRNWLSTHIADAAAAKKPLLLEEHGKWLKPNEGADERARDAFYAAALDAVYASASTAGPLKGSLFWQLMSKNPESSMPRSEGGGRGLYGVRPGDHAYELAAANAAKMSALSGPLAGCVEKASGPAVPPMTTPSSVLTRDTCVDTRVRNLVGTGFEGPNCDVDIDECARGTHDCDGGSSCENLDGSFVCRCRYGFEAVAVGEGEKQRRSPRCDPTKILEELSTRLYALGADGTIACAGELLPWPLSAVGGGVDPALRTPPPRRNGGDKELDSSTRTPPPRRNGGDKELDSSTKAAAPVSAPPRVEPWRAVTLVECLQACEIANEEAKLATTTKNSTVVACEAAEFNALRGRCRLRGPGARAGGLCKSERETHVEADQSLVEKEYDEGQFEAFFRRRAA